MSVWDTYRDRMGYTGENTQDYWVKHARSSLARSLIDSPSCRDVKVDGEKTRMAIMRHAESGYKKIASMPGETLKHGGVVDWADSKWLITDVDADDLIYQRGVMRRCNHILRWVSNKTGIVHEKWCVVEDGTKYLIGERTREFLTIGDGRLSVTVAKDPDTVELQRGLRFLIDDEDSDFVTAYQITKSNKLFNVFNGEGVFRFILNEVQLTDNDNVERRIADYNNRMSDDLIGNLVPVFPDYFIRKAAETTGGDGNAAEPSDDNENNGVEGSGQDAQSEEDEGGWI